MSIRCRLLVLLLSYVFTDIGHNLTNDWFISLLCAVAGGFAALEVEKMG
jgi:hypothetical protein